MIRAPEAAGKRALPASPPPGSATPTLHPERPCVTRDDIADVLGCEPAAVRQMVSRARRKLGRFLSGHCSLADPSGACRCRMRREVQAIDLPAEYARLRKTVRRVRVFQESETALPPKDFWLESSQTVA